MYDGPNPVGAAAAAAGGLAAELLQSVVDVARAIFGAQASSVFLLDEATYTLVFQAVSGQGEAFLVGRRFPASEGIAGWVIASGDALVVDDLTDNNAFARDLAETTEFVPDTIMAAPLIHGERILGVLEVLDPVPQSRSNLSDLDLLAMFARQAAAALRVVVDLLPHLGTPEPELAAGLDPAGRQAAAQLVRYLQDMLGRPAGAVSRTPA